MLRYRALRQTVGARHRWPLDAGSAPQVIIRRRLLSQPRSRDGHGRNVNTRTARAAGAFALHHARLGAMDVDAIFGAGEPRDDVAALKNAYAQSVAIVDQPFPLAIQ